MSLLNYMDSADAQLKESLSGDFDDYLEEIKQRETITMTAFLATVFLLFLTFFACSLIRKISEIEVVNFVLNKLVSIAKAK